MSKRSKIKKMKRISIYGVSAASVFITTLWLKNQNSMKMPPNQSIILFHEEMKRLK